MPPVHNHNPLAQSTAKPGETANEDAVRATGRLLAVADGAGGTGIYAGEWARYLVACLPEQPITTFEGLDTWLAGIWQPFFERYREQPASPEVLAKFMEEGSAAALAAIWLPENPDEPATALAFGDSVALCYDPQHHTLSSTHPDLAAFAGAPTLLNWKTEPRPEGLSICEWPAHPEAVLLVCSDALAQYLLGAFALQRDDAESRAALTQLRQQPHRLAAYLEKLTDAGFDRKNWYTEVLRPLLDAAQDAALFRSHLYERCAAGWLLPDDYALAAVVPAAAGSSETINTQPDPAP